MNNFGMNLLAGLRLAMLLPVEKSRFRISAGQLVLFIAFALFLDVVLDTIRHYPADQFNLYGVSYLLALYFIHITTVYLLTLFNQHAHAQNALLILYAALPLLILGSGLLYLWIENHYASWLMWLYPGFVMLWLFVIFLRMAQLTFASSRSRQIISAFAYTLIPIGCAFILPEQPLWFKAIDPGFTQRSPVNVENLYYQQTPRLLTALSNVEKGDPKTPELYFLGFAPDSQQDVFKREINDVHAFFQHRFNTEKRSLVLINHHDTLHELPLANGHNLNTALKDYGNKMNADDLLFMHLTSHGSKSHELSVKLPPMQFNRLPADKLATFIQNSGIPWKIILVSACYSGGFIDKLKAPDTLVITASAHDRQSFGCSNTSDSTWFTDAYFNHGMKTQSDFIRAFELAKDHVRQKEKAKGYEPSLPQIHIGSDIKARLKIWTATELHPS